MSKCLEGIQIQRTTIGLRLRIGTTVEYLRRQDIDKSGRGYFFSRIGQIQKVTGRQVMIDDNWLMFSDIAEMVEVRDSQESRATT